MSDDRHTVTASIFRAWWQSLVDQNAEEIAPGNSFSAGDLLATLAGIGLRNGAVIMTREGDDGVSRSWPELDPTFDWNGEIDLGPEAPIADLERATSISEQAPLA